MDLERGRQLRLGFGFVNNQQTNRRVRNKEGGERRRGEIIEKKRSMRKKVESTRD